MRKKAFNLQKKVPFGSFLILSAIIINILDILFLPNFTFTFNLLIDASINTISLGRTSLHDIEFGEFYYLLLNLLLAKLFSIISKAACLELPSADVNNFCVTTAARDSANCALT